MRSQILLDSHSFESNLALRWTSLHGELHLVASVETWRSSGRRCVALRRCGGRQKSCDWRRKSCFPGCHAHRWDWYSRAKTGCGWLEAPWKVASSEVSAVRWGVGFLGSRFAVLEGFEFPGLGRQRVKMSAPGTFRQVQGALWSQKMSKMIWISWIWYELIWDNILYTMLHTLWHCHSCILSHTCKSSIWDYLIVYIFFLILKFLIAANSIPTCSNMFPCCQVWLTWRVRALLIFQTYHLSVTLLLLHSFSQSRWVTRSWAIGCNSLDWSQAAAGNSWFENCMTLLITWMEVLLGCNQYVKLQRHRQGQPKPRGKSKLKSLRPKVQRWHSPRKPVQNQRQKIEMPKQHLK